MISDKHLRDVVVGNFDDPSRGYSEFHIRLFGETKQHNGRIMWVDFQVFQVVGVDIPSRRRFYNRRDSPQSPDPVYSFDEAQPLASGFVKWDGCTQFEFDDGIHVDGRLQLRELFAAVEEARRLAAAEMPAEMIAEEYPENER